MKIQHVTIENLFAYYGHCKLDLSIPNPKKPIVVLLGRNGHGKTSFLKSLWLLFLGPEHRLLREVGYRTHILGWRQALRGTDDELYPGAFNTRARNDGNASIRFGITAELLDEDGATTVIKRYWGPNLNNIDQTGDLEVQLPDGTLSGEDAQHFLLRHFPPAAVPYFFFDGEQIQEFAESREKERTEQIEVVLGLRHTIYFDDELDLISKNYGRANLQKTVQTEIKKSESEIGIVDAEIQQKQTSLDEAQYDIGRLEEKRDILQRRIENITRGGGSENPEKIDARVKELTRELYEDRDDFLKFVLPILPVFSSENLLRLTVKKIRKSFEFHQQDSGRVFQELIDDAPTETFDKGTKPSPPLTPGQLKLLKAKLVSFLTSRLGDLSDKPAPEWDLQRSGNPFDKFQQITGLIQSAHREKERAARLLSSLSGNLQKITQEEEKKLNLGSLRESERREVEGIRFQLNELNENHRNATNEEGKLKGQIQNLNIRREKLTENHAALEKQERESIKHDSKARLAVDLRGLVKAYRLEKRKRHRTEIETKLNNRFAELFSGHRQASRLSVDDDFVVRAFDSKGADIPVAGFSHGMRQLMATALIWSVTEQSRYNLPVFIDTPLARLDRGNQDNLLVNYYPKTGGQVVLMATDSELDDRKLSLIRNYVTRIINIRNKDGDNAKFDLQEAR